MLWFFYYDGYTRGSNHDENGTFMTNIFGEYLKKLRLERQLTLRSFCEANGFDPGNYSKLERGVLAPPRDEHKLEPYREALNLSTTSTEWFELQRLASISRGEIPAKLLTDAEMVQKLPALFRTLEAGSISAEELDDLIATLQAK